MRLLEVHASSWRSDAVGGPVQEDLRTNIAHTSLHISLVTRTDMHEETDLHLSTRCASTPVANRYAPSHALSAACSNAFMQHLKFYRPEDDTVHEGPDRVLPCKLQCKHCGTWIADEVCPAGHSMEPWNPAATFDGALQHTDRGQCCIECSIECSIGCSVRCSRRTF